jgi:transcriptional regulator with XRE-family HTH domain
MDRKELLREVSGKLFLLRKSLHLNKIGMSLGMGMSVSSYYKNEAGLNGLDMLTMHKLAKKFNISLDWLVLGRGEMIYKSPNEIKKEVSQSLEKISTHETEKNNEDLREDLKELMDHMDCIPLLRYEVLTMFHKFKESKKSLIEEAMKLTP